MDATPPAIWADVEDIFGYTVENPRPSGIQRLAFELLSALRDLAGPGRLRLVRHAADAAMLCPVSWDSLAALFDRLAAPVRRERPAPPRPMLRGRSLALVEALPPDIRVPLRRAGGLQREAAREFRALLGALREPADVAPVPAPSQDEAPEIRPGDIYLVLGAAWTHPEFADLLAALRARHQVHVALLLYDLIPLRRPEWCVRQLSESFATWFAATVPLCDTLLAISRSTAQEVERYAEQHGIALPGPVQPIPIGTGFGGAQAAAEPALGLPQPGSYVLFVSTLEARKNHMLLFRLWRRLLEERGPAAVPDLVFAGRQGWLVADLVQQLENTGWLGSKVRFIRDPSDAELRALYAGCRFTIFPSLYEGWGLPVSESLALGKPCLCAAALAEAGGPLARYFDPESLASVHAAVTAILDDPAGLAAWEAEVRQDFRPTPWSATAAALLHALPA